MDEEAHVRRLAAIAVRLFLGSGCTRRSLVRLTPPAPTGLNTRAACIELGEVRHARSDWSLLAMSYDQTGLRTTEFHADRDVAEWVREYLRKELPAASCETRARLTLLR